MHARTTLHAVVLAAATAAVLPGCGPSAAPSPDPGTAPSALVLSAEQRSRVGVESVTPVAFTRTVEVTGTVAFDGDLSTQVVAPISGPVSRLLVSVGDTVRKGDPMAMIASPDFAAAVGAYRKAEAAAANARRIADLDEQLFANDAIARREMEQAQTDAVSAEADRDAARQQLRSLGLDDAAIDGIRAHREAVAPAAAIRAPLAGTVVERLVNPGQLLAAGSTPCFTVADLSTVWVMASVFESDLPFVAVGDPADVAFASSERSLAGTVTYISALVDPVTRAVPVRVTTANAGGLLRKDMYVRVAIRSRRSMTGLLVPTSAVLRDDENLPFVYVENADGSFSRRGVGIGYRTGDREEVTSGLAAGDRVVTEGGLFMQFAQSQ